MRLHKRNSTREHRNSGLPEWRVPLAETCFTDEEVQNVSRTLRSGWWTSGSETCELEREWKSYLNIRHAVAVSSGTAALHLAFRALGLQQNDEVVMPSLNFVAAANTVLHFGAVPHFADVASVSTPTVTEETIKRALTKKTKGIVVMHYGGHPCPMDAIMDLAEQYRLWVVEDAAHAPGASWQGRPCGRWGDIACFSFFGNKNISCAEGGMAVTDRDAIAQKLLLLRSHGMSSLTWDRYRGHNFSYDVTTPGFNFRLDDIRSALLRTQLKSLDRFNALRRERIEWYMEFLGGETSWTIPFKNSRESSSCHLFVVVLAEGLSRNAVMSCLKSRGIQSSIHYPPTHRLSYYRNAKMPHQDLPVTEALGNRILTLPLYPAMTYEQVKIVCEAFREAVDQEGRNYETRKMA